MNWTVLAVALIAAFTALACTAMICSTIDGTYENDDKKEK